MSGMNNSVGPVMRSGELAFAVAEAAEEDNPGKEIRVDDKRAYLRIETDGEMILRRETIERALGRPFVMNDLEVDLSSFAGQIETLPDAIRFYFNKKV
jgi:toluene monooxygenase system protein D